MLANQSVIVNAIGLRMFRDYVNELQIFKVEVIGTSTINTKLF